MWVKATWVGGGFRRERKGLPHPCVESRSVWERSNCRKKKPGRKKKGKGPAMVSRVSDLNLSLNKFHNKGIGRNV